MVNLGGTAIGTGLTAPRDYIFRVVDKLREETGFGLARAENLVDATQNADAFVEVSGILKAHAVNLLKISSDLRLLASGPRTGLGELRLPARQAGSSIMPGKVNPVICEAVAQAAMLAIGNDAIITMAAGAGQLELNAFLPLLAHALLQSLSVLEAACTIFRTPLRRGHRGGPRGLRRACRTVLGDGDGAGAAHRLCARRGARQARPGNRTLGRRRRRRGRNSRRRNRAPPALGRSHDRLGISRMSETLRAQGSVVARSEATRRSGGKGRCPWPWMASLRSP